MKEYTILELSFNEMKEGDIVKSAIGDYYCILNIKRCKCNCCCCKNIKEVKVIFFHNNFVVYFYEDKLIGTRRVFRFN